MKKLLIAALIACSMPAPATAEDWPPCCGADGRQITPPSYEPLVTEFSPAEATLIETKNRDGFRFWVVAKDRATWGPLTKEQLARLKPAVDQCSLDVSFSRGAIPYDVCIYDGVGNDVWSNKIVFLVAREPQPTS